MKIDIVDLKNIYSINIDGVANCSNDYKYIVKSIEECSDELKTLEINITNSFTIASSLIGLLLKKVKIDKRDIKINVDDESMLELFRTLNLLEVFKVNKV